MPDYRTSSKHQRIESDAKAQFNLGKRYVVGEGVHQDDVESSGIEKPPRVAIPQPRMTSAGCIKMAGVSRKMTEGD